MADDPFNPDLSSVTQPGTTSVQPPPNLKQRLKESYNAIAPFYSDQTVLHRHLHMNITARLLRLLQAERGKNGVVPPSEDGAPSPQMPGLDIHMQPVLRGKHALEVGCGSGVPVLELLLAEEMDTIGVDLSRGQLYLARAHFPNETATGQAVWAEQDMMELRYPPDKFDLVVGLYSLIHLPREEQTVFLHRAFRWLKPGGMLMINFIKQEMEGQVIERWRGMPAAWMYWSSWGEEKTLQIINGLGLEVVVREETGDVLDPDFLWVIAKKH